MKKILFTLLVVLALAAPVSAQTSLTSTTLSSAVTNSQSFVVVASATGVAVGGALYVDHELMKVTAVSGTRITVTRQQAPAAHAASSTVIVVPVAAVPLALTTVDPRPGACTMSNYQFLPIINTDSGNVWLCRFIGTAVTSRVWAATNITAINGQTSLLINLQ